MPRQQVHQMRLEFMKWPLDWFGPNLDNFIDALAYDCSHMLSDCEFYSYDIAVLIGHQEKYLVVEVLWHLLKPNYC
jgi:hypothetical protein